MNESKANETLYEIETRFFTHRFYRRFEKRHFHLVGLPVCTLEQANSNYIHRVPTNSCGGAPIAMLVVVLYTTLYGTVGVSPVGLRSVGQGTVTLDSMLSRGLVRSRLKSRRGFLVLS